MTSTDLLPWFVLGISPMFLLAVLFIFWFMWNQAKIRAPMPRTGAQVNVAWFYLAIAAMIAYVIFTFFAIPIFLRPPG